MKKSWKFVLCEHFISGIYWLWCWFTEVEVRWEQFRLSFSFFTFFLLLGFCFWWCLKAVQFKRILLFSSKKVFFVGRKPEITTLTSFASEVKKCCFFQTKEILSISFLFKSCYKSLSIFPPITNQCSLRILHQFFCISFGLFQKKVLAYCLYIYENWEGFVVFPASQTNCPFLKTDSLADTFFWTKHFFKNVKCYEEKVLEIFLTLKKIFFSGHFFWKKSKKKFWKTFCP